MNTNKTQSLKLLLDDADFAKFLAMEDVRHYDLYKPVERKCYVWIRTIDGEGVISILI